jgi:hypothetical protein
VRQGQGHRAGREFLAGQDPVGARARQQRADRQAQLVQQAGRGQLGQQVRSALGEHPLVAAIGQRADRGVQVDGGLAGRDDVRAPRQLGPQVLRRRGGGDDDGAGVRRGLGEQRALGVEVQPRADHRDRGSRGPAVAQVRPAPAPPRGPVALGPGRARADHDDVGERAEQEEDPPVGLR